MYLILVIFRIILIGRRTATSTSKIRKINVVMKNRSEKALRAFLNGENPHSNGVIFSWLIIDFSLIKIFRVNIMNEIKIDKIIRGVSVNIRNLINR